MFAATRMLAAMAAVAGSAAAADPPDTSKMNILFINIEIRPAPRHVRSWPSC